MLMQQLNKKALKDTLESELKEQMREKFRRDAEAEAKAEAENIFHQRKVDMEKELEFIKIKEAMQLDKLRQQNEIRDKLLHEKLNEETRRQSQLQELMKEKMMYEKNELESFAVQRRQ